MLFIVIFIAVILTACSPTNQSTVSRSTPTPAGTYDGAWNGKGTTQNGIEVDIRFIVKDSVITSFIYTYPTQGGLRCSSLHYDDVSPESYSKITNRTFSFSLPATLSFDGRLNTDTSASGSLTFNEVNGPLRVGCAANMTLSWNANKEAEKPTALVTPLASSWCGKSTDCKELILQLILFGLVNGMILAFSAIGITVIYSTVRILNLAHGDVFALTTVFVTSTINLIGLNLNWPPLNRFLILALIFIGAMLIGALLSVIVEVLAFRPFRGRSKLAPLIASLGLSFILYQGSLVWRTFQRSFIRGEHRSVPGLAEVPNDGIPNFFPTGNLLHGKVVLQYSDVFVLVTGILFVLTTLWIIQRTQLGKSIRAVAQNDQLAQIVGVNRERAIRNAFALGGALAGAAAFVFAMYYGRPFGQAGQESGLTAFAAALMGGVGSPVGAMASGIILNVVGSFSDYFLSAQWTPVLLLALLTAILVWRRGGLLNRDEGTEESGMRDSVILTKPGEGQKAGRWLILIFAVLIILPIITSSTGLVDEIFFRGLGVFILLTLGLNILLGLSGVLDLGYAMSFAIGAYTSAIITNRYGILVFPQFDFIVVLMISAITTALFGALKGIVAIRLRGDYLAVATLALGLLTADAISNGGTLTGGSSGLSVLPAPRIFGWTISTPSSQYYLVLVFVLLAILVSGRLIASRTGRAWIASSEDETAAGSFGIDASRYRLLAFVFSSALAGIAGSLYANTFSYIDPSIAAFDVSSLMLAMVILGGAGSVEGAVLGTVLVYFYDKLFVPQLFAWLAFFWPQGVYIGMVPNIRGTNFFDFGIVLYLTVLWRARRK